MSQEHPMLPDPLAAQEYLVGNVRGRVFLDKMASLGFPARTPEEAIQLFEISGKLAAAEADPAVQEVEKRSSFYAHANDDLNTALEANGFGYLAKNAAAEEQANAYSRKLAEAFASDPNCYNAALSLKTAEAEAIQQQMQAQ